MNDNLAKLLKTNNLKENNIINPVDESLSSFAIASELKKNNYPTTLVILKDSILAEQTAKELSDLLKNKIAVRILDSWETLAYDIFSPSAEIISNRLEVLYKLAQQEKIIVIATVSTILHYIAPVEYIMQHSLILKNKQKLSLTQFKNKLVTYGYHLVESINNQSEFSVKGSIVDVWLMGGKKIYRIDFFDDEIDSIRIINNDTKETISKVNEIKCLPAKEHPSDSLSIKQFQNKWLDNFPQSSMNSYIYKEIEKGIFPAGIEYYLTLFFNSLSTVFDYLNDDSLVFVIGDITQKINEVTSYYQSRYKQLQFDTNKPILSPEKLILSIKNIKHKLLQNNAIELKVTNKCKDKIDCIKINDFKKILNTDKKLDLASITSFIKSSPDYKIIFTALTNGRREMLLESLISAGIIPTTADFIEAFENTSSKLFISSASFSKAVVFKTVKIIVIPEFEIFRAKAPKITHKSSSESVSKAIDIQQLDIGCLITHTQHGVGRYKGLSKFEINGNANEFVILEYQGNDKIYVPITQLHCISRYLGADSDNVALNKLGTDKWNKAKKQALLKAQDTAAELLDIYAKRASKTRVPIKINHKLYDDFKDDVPFNLTVDQDSAIQSIIYDLTSKYYMDRVLCGDVGFGKTEVAMQAAFLQVQAGYQVAVLVPTTLLAEQHYHSFVDRFANTAISIDVLSRFQNGSKQKNTISKALDHKVDILIATHKLISSDIKFANLGMLIIDEEHRFGVNQKEKIKKYKANIDILTMTATPIPRTLNMAICGVRDLSIISTPPAKRLPIKTFVTKYSANAVIESVAREIQRGGQVYYLHNNVKTIYNRAKELSKLLPQVNIQVAHGQMPESELAEVMSDFYHCRFNLLLTTIIIETGIDIPNANTILIDRADKLGLAQLHQLRGRVGRSYHQAYAFFFIPDELSISKDAKKRLEALADSNDLGVGYTLAAQDLEIRGAGELLGNNQSGNMNQIGLNLYNKMLKKSLEYVKNNEKIPDNILIADECEIDLNANVFIPETYIFDVSTRLSYYRRICEVSNYENLKEIEIELIDTFGLIPIEAKQLIIVHKLRIDINKYNVKTIKLNVKGGKIEFKTNNKVNVEKLISFIQANPIQFKAGQNNSLYITKSLPEFIDRIELVYDILSKICN